MKRIYLFLALFIVAFSAMAQEEGNTLILNAASNGGTFAMQTDEAGIYDLKIYTENDGSGNYLDGPFDRYVVIDTGECEGERSMSLFFESFDIDPGDTLFIYDAPTPTTLLMACNNSLNPQVNTTIFPSPLNISGKLTLRFKTNGDGKTGSGFTIRVLCRDKCETIVPVIDSMFYKTKNGLIIDSAYSRWCIQVDTNWNFDSTAYTLDTQHFRGMHLCLGEGIIFKGHGEYTNYYGYGPADPWSMFEWNFGNGDDTSGIGLTMTPAKYRDVDCYDVVLKITDSKGCKSSLMEMVRVRIAQNPIKTIYDLNPVCTTDSIIVTTGEGPASTIGTRKIEFAKTKSRSISCKTFIPDGHSGGQACPQAGDDDCFFAPITFDDFPAGRVVTSKEDICSICVNHEHTWIGDYRISIQCPSGKISHIKYGNPSYDHSYNKDTVPAGTWTTSGNNVGVPYGGDRYDGMCNNGEGNNNCDSICNMFGDGMDYCFSKNGDYLLNRGEPCNTATPEERDYFCSNDWYDTQEGYTFQTIPAPYINAGYTAPPKTVTYKHPSNHEEKRDYYLPAQDFSELVGCPLNGEWTILVCDPWGGDNGWVFSWSLDFCGISSGAGCEYQVDIDSVIWLPDSNYGDFDLGYWRGVNIDNHDPARSIISCHDTASPDPFPIFVHIYDNFGCVWDTSLNYYSVWAPNPVLGNDTTLCDVETITLDASDRHTAITNQDFTWSPFGQVTDTITTRGMMGSSTLYTVEVTNREKNITCVTRDSIRVNINRQPIPNFDPGVYPLEGCEPYTIRFDNTSQFGDSYLWVFGDGDSSRAMSPSHTYGTGQYNFKYFISNNNGCHDSLVYEDLITVYPSPVAKFSWEPLNPTVMHPSVTFENLTVPQTDDNKYYWEIQYDRDNPISYHTLTDLNPTFEWWTDGEDISGTYIARLIAMTANRGPSGYITECRDTVENNILLVNDFLQFPNAITPNGDGINDRFEIVNLINGFGYPNNSLAIYDRWGKRVFYKENISKEEDFWDPADDNIPAGTYFWRFSGKGYLGDIQRNGAVEVIK